MSSDRIAQTQTSQGGDVLDEAYRRIVEVHYALAEATRPNEELHHWCLGQLMELLHYLDGHRQPARPE